MSAAPTDRAAESPWIVFALSGVAVFLVSLDATVMVAAYPALVAEYRGVTPALLSWTLNAYGIVYAALLVPAGRMADLWGRKRLFLRGLLLFTAASALCGLAPSPPWLIAARCVQAIGAALTTPTSLALVLGAFAPTQRAAAVGLWSAVGALAAAIGPAFGSLVIETTSWRWVFLINVPIGIVGWWASARRLAESRNRDAGARPDLPGIGLLIGGVSLIALAIVQGDSWRWGSTPTLLAAGGGLAVLALFVAWARGRPDAAIDLQLFADRSFAFTSLATLAFGLAFTAMFLSSFLFQMGVWGYSQALAGLALTPGPLVVIPVAIACGRLAPRVGYRPLLVAGGLLYAASQAALALRIGGDAAYLRVWLPSQLLTGVAIGLILPALSGAAVAGLPPHRFGVGGGVNNALRQIGGALGAAVAVALVGGAAAGGLARFRVLYALLASCGVLVALLSLPIATRPARANVAVRQAQA